MAGGSDRVYNGVRDEGPIPTRWSLSVAGRNSDVLRESPLPVALARELDLLCDDFERRLRQGERPRLEDYLHRVPAEAADALRSELLTVEREWRCQAAAGLPSSEQPGDNSPTVRPEQGK